MNLQNSFVETRSRRNDPESSKIAAVNSAGDKAKKLRKDIQAALKIGVPMTARELSILLHADYYAVQRRMSECANIRKNGRMMGDCMLWEWCGQ